MKGPPPDMSTKDNLLCIGPILGTYAFETTTCSVGQSQRSLPAEMTTFLGCLGDQNCKISAWLHFHQMDLLSLVFSFSHDGSVLEPLSVFTRLHICDRGRERRSCSDQD